MDVEELWNKRKQELLEGIDATLASGGVDKATLEVMRELLRSARVNNSISEYYKEVEDE